MTIRIAPGLLAATAVLVFTACGGAAKNRQLTTAVPAHTETWAYDDSMSPRQCNGGYGASAKLVRRWLTYAETNCGSGADKAIRDCHARGVRYCLAVQYLDAGRAWPSNPIRHAPSREAWWLHQAGHDDAAHRLTETVRHGETAYWVNQKSSQVQFWLRTYARRHFDRWDALMMDDTSACKRTQFYGSGYRSSEEIRTDAAVRAEHAGLARALTHSNRRPFIQIDNGVQPNPHVCSGLPLLNRPANVGGVIAEGAPWDHGFSAYYSDLLDVISAVDATRNDFIVLLSYAERGGYQARRVQEATVLLGYVPGHVVSWADLESDSPHLAVWPEEGIYPTLPLQSMTKPGGSGCFRGGGKECASGGHNDLLVASGKSSNDAGAGVYRREFAMCYDRSVPVGPCAAIVNDTSHRVVVRSSWLNQSYTHRITFVGGDVQSGGKINFTGASFIAGRTTVAPGDAILIAR
jgi:hypothetical protein